MGESPENRTPCVSRVLAKPFYPGPETEQLPAWFRPSVFPPDGHFPLQGVAYASTGFIEIVQRLRGTPDRFLPPGFTNTALLSPAVFRILRIRKFLGLPVPRVLGTDRDLSRLFS
jgi:hypothetical protein